jgi:hypothetical protein
MSLTRAADLLEVLESITPELRRAASSGAWDGYEAITARVALEIYDRAVRELRAVALDTRTRLRRAEAACADAREFARRRRRRAGKIALRRKER